METVALRLTNTSQRLFDEEEMYSYIKSYAAAKGMEQTLKALSFAKEKHAGQVRDGEEKVPYIYHPLLVSCHALALGLNDDDLIAAALLHDVCEDCEVLPGELPVGEEARQAVVLLTKDPSPERKTQRSKEKYFEGIAGNRIAIMVKLLDRCSNVSSMSPAFSPKKMARYIRETEEWIYPLFEKARAACPQYSDQLFLIQYHTASLVQSLKKQSSETVQP